MDRAAFERLYRRRAFIVWVLSIEFQLIRQKIYRNLPLWHILSSFAAVCGPAYFCDLVIGGKRELVAPLASKRWT